jgi:hypothetical protein
MREILKNGLLALGVIAIMSMVMACEPGDGSTGTATDQGTSDETTAGDDGSTDGSGTSCETDEDCPGEELCDLDSSTCYLEGGSDGSSDGSGTSCETDEDCPGEELCDLDNGTCYLEGGTDEDDSYAVLEIQDDPDNPTLDPCDKGTLKSPGADIDAAELVEGDDVIATLTNCELQNPGNCESTADDAATAEGGPDGTGNEETGTYVALNGGRLRCEWSDGIAVTSGQVITVYEIGGSGSTKVEQYTVRMCISLEGQCTKDSNYASGKVEFETDSFF